MLVNPSGLMTQIFNAVAVAVAIAVAHAERKSEKEGQREKENIFVGSRSGDGGGDDNIGQNSMFWKRTTKQIKTSSRMILKKKS